jgi:hypothetical protein
MLVILSTRFRSRAYKLKRYVLDMQIKYTDADAQ